MTDAKSISSFGRAVPLGNQSATNWWIAPAESTPVRQWALILQSDTQVATMDHQHERQQQPGSAEKSGPASGCLPLSRYRLAETQFRGERPLVNRTVLALSAFISSCHV